MDLAEVQLLLQLVFLENAKSENVTSAKCHIWNMSHQQKCRMRKCYIKKHKEKIPISAFVYFFVHL